MRILSKIMFGENCDKCGYDYSECGCVAWM